MKEKLRRRRFYHDLEKVLEPSIDQKKKSAEETKKAMTSGSENLRNNIFKQKEVYDQRIRRNKVILTTFINSNLIHSSVVNTLANLLNS